MSWERLDDEPEPAWREAAPDIHAPIDPTAPVSGHQPPAEAPRSHSEAPEHQWEAAADRIFAALRPAGTHGASLEDLDGERLAHEGMKKHALPLVDPGPADLSVVYVLREESFDVVINADHLLTWGIDAQTLRDRAAANLREWSATAPWTDELAGDRHLVSSDTGSGGDAARILLPEARAHLAGRCGGPSRVLVALPDRDLLMAASLPPTDDAFLAQFEAFVADLIEGAHEPIEGGLFELVGDEHELVRFVR
ncbi:MAG TPA: hypothetical protein VE011_07480 [Candidatus Dormibacteraeota bacterium]|nr:hypothetical protein [Candidatus Dormibacteraeota bacterium]